MKSIITKELTGFFASPMGYLVIACYLVINGLFLWVFGGDFNILHAGFADLNGYFYLAPWVLLFLVPAITMRSFSDEYQSGTMELLRTLPLSSWKIVLGKYLGSLLLALAAILPTFVYAYSVYQLGEPVGNLSLGTTLGSFLGLIFLVAAYTAMGLLASALSRSQVVAFLVGVLLVFFSYSGFELLAATGIFGMDPYFIQQMGLDAHFSSISKGVLDTRDLIYFGGVALLFLKGTEVAYSGKEILRSILPLALGLAVLFAIGNKVYERFDLTEDKRYTLSSVTSDLLDSIDSPMIVEVWLEGDFPTEFKRLQIEARQLLEELKSRNRNIAIRFNDPADYTEELVEMGLEPSTLQVEENVARTESVIFPWAVLTYENRALPVSLLAEVYSNAQNDQMESSIQQLEYNFTTVMRQLVEEREHSIAVLRGNGELDDLNLYDMLRELGAAYRLAPFTLDSVQTAPERTLDELRSFDLAVIAKPTESFSEEEKLVLDQYLMAGGKTLWLVDQVATDLDSLMGTGSTVALARDLNLTDLFFNYGIRLNYDLVQDRFCTRIPLATGQVGNQTQYNAFPWTFYPLLPSFGSHPITSNILHVQHKFTGSIDTLRGSVKKTVLLRSSPQSKTVGTPVVIALNSIRDYEESAQYNDGGKPTAVLLEGNFRSAYLDRTKPLSLNDYRDRSEETAMVVIADGDLIANEVSRGEPLQLGVNNWTGERFGNKEFLGNVVNYLLGDTAMLKLRSKAVEIAFLDKERAYNEATRWQLINLVGPLLLLGAFGLIFTAYRRRKYANPK
jgi:ABC-2 type transport system permease protein